MKSYDELKAEMEAIQQQMLWFLQDKLTYDTNFIIRELKCD